MTGAPRTDAPATVAPQRHLLSRPKPSPNQNQNALSVSPSHTPTSSSSFTPLTLTQTCAYTLIYSQSKCCWGASVAGEQMSQEHQSCYRIVYVFSKKRNDSYSF